MKVASSAANANLEKVRKLTTKNRATVHLVMVSVSDRKSISEYRLYPENGLHNACKGGTWTDEVTFFGRALRVQKLFIATAKGD